MKKEISLPLGYQHTMGLIGVSFARAAMEIIGPGISYNKTNSKRAERINCWIDNCSAHLQTKKLSQGAKRSLDSASVYVGSFVDKFDKNEEERLHVWTSVLSMANLFVFDARRFCIKITKGDSCWRYLDQTTYSLVRELAKICPEAEDLGWEMYLHLQISADDFRAKAA